MGNKYDLQKEFSYLITLRRTTFFIYIYMSQTDSKEHQNVVMKVALREKLDFEGMISLVMRLWSVDM